MSHRFGAGVSPTQRKVLVTVASVCGAATLVGLFLLRPTGEPRRGLESLGFASEVVDAEVVEAEDTACQGQTDATVTCKRVAFRIVEGIDSGRPVSQEFVGAGGSIPDLKTGDPVLLARDANAADPEFEYRYLDRDRGSLLVWLFALFILAVVALGRLRGLTAIVGLAASMFVLVQFVLPAVLDGRSPLMVAIVGASAIAFLALYLAHGFTTMTTVALLGTLSALALTAVLGSVFAGLAELTGVASEEAVVVQVGAASLDLRGIVLGGIVIGALGAIDDMTVTQASAVWELRAVDPRMSKRGLLRSGLRIGRDHVASTVNTLALAYAGASMPILLLLVLSQQGLTTIASGEVIATEIIRTLVGSIGLVAAVPVTTWLAAATAPGPGEGPAEG